jgi:hypothetical protein
MFGDTLADYLNQTYMSLGGQLSQLSKFKEGIAESQASIKSSWVGDPNTKVTKGGSTDQIDWNNGDLPAPKTGQHFTNYFILAVIQYIAQLENGKTGDDLQKAEASRSVWSNLINATNSEADLQGSPFTTLSDGASAGMTSTTSEINGMFNTGQVVGGLSGLAGDLSAF